MEEEDGYYSAENARRWAGGMDDKDQIEAGPLVSR